MPTVLDELSGLTARLRAAASRVDDNRTALRLATVQRNRLIIAAVDAGIPQKQVAAAASVAQPHVVRILSHQDDYTDTDDPGAA